MLQTAAYIPVNSYRNWQNLKNSDGTLNSANPNNYYNQYNYNPWFSLDNGRSTTRRNSFQGNANLDYDIAPWMKATYRIALTNGNAFNKLTTDKFIYNAYRKSSAQQYPPTDIAGSVRDNSNYNTKISQDAYLTFDKKFSKSFKSTLILGSNINDEQSQNIRIATTALVIPGLFNANNRVGEPVLDPNFDRNSTLLKRNIGLYASLSLGFKDYLFLEVAGRNDWTSLLDKENNSFFYPSANLSFVVSNAIPALRDSKALSFAKLTFGASKVGQININPYETKAIFNVGAGFPYGGVNSFTVGNRVVQKGLKPEFTTAYEVGMELGFFDRMNLELSAYQSATVNQTLPISNSWATGYNQLLTNIGGTDSRGVEVTLRGDVVKTKSGFTWGISTNYSYRDNKVTELYSDVKSVNVADPSRDQAFQTGGGIFAVVGEQYPMLQVSAYARDPQGRVIVDAASGLPSAASSLLVAGQTAPKHIVGLGTTLSYKGFSLYALAEYRAGNVVYHDLGYDLAVSGRSIATVAYNRERFVFPNSSIASGANADGTPTYVANTTILSGADGADNFWDASYRRYGENFVTSGAFWKLREARLSYTVPTTILAEASKYIKGLSISFVGRNLLMFLPSTNVFADPEFGTSTSNAVGASNSFNTPTTRTYGFNLNVTL